MSKEVKDITAFFKSMTALVKAKYGDEGAVSNVTKAVSNLQKSQPEFEDEEFQQACNDLATAAAAQVSVAGIEEAKEDPPSLASGMAHTGENPYRKVGPTDPKTGTTQKEQVGDATPEHDHTKKKPQPSVGSASTAKPGDMTTGNNPDLVK